MGASGLRPGCSWSAEVVITGDSLLFCSVVALSRLRVGEVSGKRSRLLASRRERGERKALLKALWMAGQRSPRECWGKALKLEDFLL